MSEMNFVGGFVDGFCGEEIDGDDAPFGREAGDEVGEGFCGGEETVEQDEGRGWRARRRLAFEIVDTDAVDEGFVLSEGGHGGIRVWAVERRKACPGG